jgi:UDP-GlcNAc:undecaprenyl-phosphate GlcNAc-1-phosphate transferase
MIEIINFYGVSFWLSCCFSIFFSLIIIQLVKKYSFFDKLFVKNRKDKRHFQTINSIKSFKKISRFGGVAIISAFILALYLNQNIVFELTTYAIIIGAILILIFGVVDDFTEINWRWQLFFQIAIITFIFLLGIQIDFITNPFGGVLFLNTFFSFFFTLIWVLVIMNAINWSDGVDGLAGGTTFLASVVLFLLALRPEVNQPPLAIITIILAGSVGGFLLFNFPPAKIFAGTSGAFFMGYLIAVLAIMAGAKIGTTLLVLAIPLTDAIFVLGQRLKNKESIFQADTKHLHYQLLQLNWSVKQILLFYYFITIVGAIIALSTQAVSKFLALVIFVIIIFSFCYFLNRKVNKY